MANNIIGDSFDNYVKEQILVRQSVLGLGLNDKDTVIYKNNNSAFVRLTSGVNVDTNIVTSLGLAGEGYKGSGLAKQFKLFSARTQNNGTETFTKGIGYDNLSSYGFSSNSDYGYVPPPGIISAEVKAMNRGSLREANIEIQCHNLQQFQILEILYMRLKYSVLLEWGHNMYYSNPTRDKNLDITQQPRLEQSRFDLSDKMLDGTQTHESMLSLIAEERKRSYGNYDAFFGLVTNFSWTLRPDGGYNITVTARSTGDVIESLKLNATYPIKNDLIKPDLSSDGSSNTALQTDYYKSSLNRILSAIVVKLYGLNYTHGIDQGDSGYNPIHNYKLEEYTGLKAAFNRTPKSEVTNDADQRFLTYNEAIQIDFPNLSEGMFNTGTQYYMKLGTLLRIIESFLIYYDTSKNQKEGKPPIFKIDYDYENNYCLTFPRHASISPKVCLIPLANATDASSNIDVAIETTYTFYSYDKVRYNKQTGQDTYTPNYSWEEYQYDRANNNAFTNAPGLPWGKVEISEIERGSFSQIIPYNVVQSNFFYPDLDSFFAKDKNADIGDSITLYNQPKSLNNNSSKTEQAHDLFLGLTSTRLAPQQPQLGSKYLIKAPTIAKQDERGRTADPLKSREENARLNKQGFVQEYLIFDGVFEQIWVQQFASTFTTREYRSTSAFIAPTESTSDSDVYSKILKENKFRAGGYKGRMMHMMVNMEYIASTLSDHINVETGEISIYDFLDNLMKGIQHALGNVNNFEIIYNEETNTHRIIDNTVIPGLGNISGLVEFNANLLQTPRETFSDGTNNGKVGGSFIKNVNFKTKLSNNFATMTTIGAQKNGNVVGANSTMLSRWNDGLTDRIITNRGNPNYDETENASELDVTFVKNAINLQNFNSLVDKRTIGDYEINSSEGSFNDLFQAELGKFTQLPPDNEASIPGIGFIPFDLELTMLGLSGPRIYEAYTIDTTLLPNSYKDKIQFICTGVSHRISDGEWVTTLNSIAGPKPYSKSIFNPPAVKVLLDRAEANDNGGGDCTPNSPIIDQSTATGTLFTDRNTSTIAGVKLNNITSQNQKFINSEYLPELNNIQGLTKGLKVLITAQAIHEGFYDNTKARRFNNPGNIGNTDDGSTKDWGTLAAGIQAQVDYVKNVANGTKFPFGPIKRNNKFTGGRCVPGFDINFQGELGYYLWIYATGPRFTNDYLNDLIGFFKYNGIDINYRTKIQDIIAIN
jgi:hypothetical protein